MPCARPSPSPARARSRWLRACKSPVTRGAMKMNHTRRSLLKSTLFGTGSLGLRALATGLPASFLARPLAARAEELACWNRERAKHLIVSTSAAGDPLNANVPGTYDFPDIAHSPDPRMAATDFLLGGRTVRAAQVWSTLPPWVLERT